LVLAGWLWADPLWLKAYLIFLPMMMLHWRCNQDACVLTNLEYFIAHDPHERPSVANQEPFVGHLLHTIYRRPVSRKTTESWSYGIVMVAWLLGLMQLLRAGG
jgi:hypothetical protein